MKHIKFIAKKAGKTAIITGTIMLAYQEEGVEETPAGNYKILFTKILVADAQQNVYHILPQDIVKASYEPFNQKINANNLHT